MPGKSNAHADQLLNYEWRGVAYAPPADHRIALFSTLPADDGTGGVELTGTGYARAVVARAASSWAAPAAGAGDIRQISNAAVVSFGTAGSDWAPAGAPCVGWGAFGADGTYKGGGAFGSAKIIQNGDPVSFPIGSLIIRDA